MFHLPDPPQNWHSKSSQKGGSTDTNTAFSERLPITGYASDVERNIHNSCSCPADLAKGLNVEQTLAGHISQEISSLSSWISKAKILHQKRSGLVFLF